MAGHSKWKNIQHRKGKQDVQKAKVFTKLIRELTISSRMGGADPTANPRLRLAMDKALSANMPRDTMDRAIKRGAGHLEEQQLEEIVYEGYGVGGVAVMVLCLSDNRNRTVSEVRHAFTKHGGSLATQGAVSYLFQRRGEITLRECNLSEEQLLDVALTAGAADLLQDEGCFVLITAADQLVAVQQNLPNDLSVDSAEVVYAPSTDVRVSGETAEQLMKMLQMLEDLDDVQEVFSNADIDASAIERFQAD